MIEAIHITAFPRSSVGNRCATFAVSVADFVAFISNRRRGSKPLAILIGIVVHVVNFGFY